MNCIVLAIQIIPYSRIHYLNLLNIHFSSHTRDNIYWCLQGESQMQQATVYNVSAAWELRLGNNFQLFHKGASPLGGQGISVHDSGKGKAIHYT